MKILNTMIESACAWSPDSLSFVIQVDGEKKKENAEGKKHPRGFFPREKIINAFIDSIKMKDYCTATHCSFVPTLASCVTSGKDRSRTFG